LKSLLRTCIVALIERGVRVLTSSGDDLTETSDPFKIVMRQIAGVYRSA
jgi:hypothetical protein